MPLYEFQCRECGERFEELISYSKVDEVACKSCGHKTPERLMSTFATASASACDSVAEPCDSMASGACGGSSAGFS